jgi:hypothetical protein
VPVNVASAALITAGAGMTAVSATDMGHNLTHMAEDANNAGSSKGGTDRGPTVDEVLKGKKGSITRAPLPKGSPSWSEVRDLPLSEIEQRARANDSVYKTILKLLTDTRFDK